MAVRKFYVSEGDQICVFEGQRYRCLGRLESFRNEQTPIAREVQAWWQKQLESDEPLPMVPGTGRR